MLDQRRPHLAGAPVGAGDRRRVAPTTQAVLAALGKMRDEPENRRRAQLLVRLATQLAGADAGVLLIYDEQGSVVRTLHSAEDAGHQTAAVSIAAQRERARRTGLNPSPTSQDDALPPARRLPVRITADVPGSLYLLGIEEPDDGNDLVREFVDLAALVLESGVRHQECMQQLAWRVALADVTQLLLSGAGDNELVVWQRIADHLLQLTRSRTATFAARSEDDPDQVVLSAVAGLGRETLVGTTYSRSGTLVDEVMTTSESQLVAAGGRLIPAEVARLLGPVGPMLGIPLLGTEAPHGAVVLSRGVGDEEYNRRDQVMVEEFAAQATLALELAETRAAQISLQARTELERVSDTFQDRIIQRLFALGLTLDMATRQDTEEWLERARTELAETLAEARGSLQRGHGMVDQ